LRFLRNNDDLTTIIALNICLSFLIFLIDVPALRIILATPFILFVPGYLLVAAVFSKKTDMDAIERVALGFPLSIAVASAIGLILNLTPWGFRLVPSFISLSAFNLAMVFIASKMRAGRPETERFSLNFISRLWPGSRKDNDHHPGFSPDEENPSICSKVKAKVKRGFLPDRALNVILGIAIFSVVGAALYAIAFPRDGEKYSEFYILGPDGKAAGYPREVIQGENVTVTMVIVNHELAPVNYNFTITDNGTAIGQQGGINLADEQTWQQPVSFVPDRNGDNKKIEFLLFKSPGAEPYLKLHLRINVK
jgi:uncharacterized membrane protein